MTELKINWMTNPLLVAISGPTSSGKTFFSNSLIQYTKKKDIEVTRISTDDFYRDLSHLSMEERKKVNYDNPASINNEEFIETVAILSQYNKVSIPEYDMRTHTRTNNYKEVLPADIILVEGIFSLSFDELNKIYDFKIYVDYPADLRFIRRLRRDMNERGRSLESVINQYTQTVRPTQMEYVLNDKLKADIILIGDQEHSNLIEMLVLKAYNQK